jgi:phosphohistidine phosphatase
MELYVLRHAIASEDDHGDRDAERTLTSMGRERLRRSTRCWEGLGVVVDVIMTSPYARARQTAELAGEALGIPDCVEICPALAAGAAPSAIVRAIAERCQEDHRVMVVGHEPDLGRLVSMLVCGNDGAGIRMKKAGLTKLSVDGLDEAGRCAVLEWHLWPRHMLLMS